MRVIKQPADEELQQMSPLFDGMYATTGRPSIPPERLLKSTLLMALYTVAEVARLVHESMRRRFHSATISRTTRSETARPLVTSIWCNLAAVSRCLPHKTSIL